MLYASGMKIELMHLGMKVRHKQYGVGEVKALGGQMADVAFAGGLQKVSPELSGLEPAEPSAEITGLQLPLRQLIEQTVLALTDQLGMEKPDAVVQQLGARWSRGKLVIHASDPTLQTKEVPLEAFFHKIVMMRNNLRTLEQKINASDKLTEAEKIEMQQYITRCYGSMTTFNLLFRNKEDQFSGGSAT
jgi:hypothetical protein